MKKLFFIGLVLALVLPLHALAYSPSDLATADKYHAEKSYQLAAAEYAKFLDQKATPALMREVSFKWSDSILRGKDEASREKAEKRLQEILDGKDSDRWRAEAAVSLSEHLIARDPYGRQQEIKKWLDEARDWWAGSSDIKLARQKFVSISFTLADFVTSRWGWYHNDIKPVRLGGGKPAPDANQRSLQVLFEEILKVAKEDGDKARAHYGLGMAYMNGPGDEKSRKKAVEKFEEVIDDYADSEWADDAFYQLGMYHENRSEFVDALKVYRKFLSRFRPGSSQWVDDAQRRIEYITTPTLAVGVSNNFTPGSEIRFSMNWRNVKAANLHFYQIDMARQISLENENNGLGNYQDVLRQLVESGRYKSLPVALATHVALKEEGKHLNYGEHKGLAEWRAEDEKVKAEPKQGKLPAGAYLMVATAAGVARPAYDLVLVSDIALVSKVADGRALFLAMDARTGKPLPNALIRFVYSYYNENGSTRWAQGQGTSGEDGLYVARLQNSTRPNYSQHHNLFGAVTAGDRQAFVHNNYYKHNNHNKGEWWLYAFTDRPAYRPKETVSFKGLLRKPKDGVFDNPAGLKVRAYIYDPQGKQVKEEEYTLNDYGAFDGELVLDEKATLGEYRLQLYTADKSNNLGSAQLFRLEEYKLPEYTVNVAPAPKAGEGLAAAYRLGDKVEMTVDAQYYFGGAVAEADVEYLVYQRPYYRTFRPYRKYGWYYEDMHQQHHRYYGNGALVTQQKIKTGKDGKAKFTIETPKDQGDLQYHVEVRVVDKSRREIRGTADVRVTKTAFFAELEAQQSLYRPGDKAKVTIRTMTANDVPVAVEGKVTVSRNTWRDPVVKDSRQISPAGYNGQEIMTKFAKTNDKGEAVFEFEPNENGYYVVEFTGFDNGEPVTAQVNVFVCDNQATNIGYRYGGLQIITEKDTYAAGETARAMVVSDTPDTWVLLTTENDNLYDYKMLHLEGSVKLVELPVRENFTPNVFFHALSGQQYQLKTTALQIIVPPDDKFLNVKVTSDKAVYQPQEDGTFEIEVTDRNGKPVSADVSIGLTDAAVYYIQGEYAPDIRQFFYGDKRQQSVQTQASFHQRAFVSLVRGENGHLMTDSEREYELRRKSQDKNAPEDALHISNERERGQLGAVGGKGDAGYRDNRHAPKKSMPSAAVAMEESANSMRQEMKEGRSMLVKDEVSGQAAGADSGSLQEPDRVRDDFRSTVVWLPSVRTDEKGRATVKAKFPDSLTTWRMTARADTKDTAVGNVTHDVKSNKELMIRLQAPRFFTERDLVAVSAIIDNMSDKALKVMPELKAEGVTVTGLYKDGKFVKGEIGMVEVPANGQTRVDWAVSAQKAGTARLTVAAKSKTLSDAMMKTYPVIPHGIEKFIAQSLVLKSTGEEVTKEIAVTIPKERIKQSTSLRLTVSPSLAANLLDALPYLADFPYGCVEQTMSRFLPAVIVKKTMRDLGISGADADAYISDVLEPRNDPKGHPQRRSDPTHSRLGKMTTEALDRLYDFQHSDGGWGWWKTGDSDRFMTSYVVWGLGLARDAGLEVKPDAIDRAVRWLQLQLVEEENAPDNLAWMLHALSSVKSHSKLEDKQRDRLWEMRDKLNPYTRALFALSEHMRGDTERSRILGNNIVNGAREDAENGTAHWGEAGVHYRWSEGGVEATAFVVKALSNIDPQSAYLDKAVKWLTLNRRGASWKNTRDTAIAILGLADYLKATRELAPDYDYIVMLDGKKLREGHVDASNVFTFGRYIDIPADALHDGVNNLKIVLKGRGSLYVSSHVKYFTLEEPITKAGNEIFVTRKYFRKSVAETLMKGYTEDWAELKDGDTVKSGDRIRVDVTLEAKNHYEYLVAEDYKPAGLEAVSLVSGAGEAVMLDREGRETQERTHVYQEFRDQKAAFFISKLKQGKHLLRYELRAEVPGEFHAMPNQTHAMYVPEIRTNSDEMRITVTD